MSIRLDKSGGVKLFKSGLTSKLYQELLNSFQLHRADFSAIPFVYVDESGGVRYLANLMSLRGAEKDVMAYVVDGEGDIEILSTEN